MNMEPCNVDNFRLYEEVQKVARDVMGELVCLVSPGVSERELAKRAEELFFQKGIKDFWYYGLAALVLVGNRTILSMSGREYEPSEAVVQLDDLVTIDLSPALECIWGDYARSIYVEAGMAKFEPSADCPAWIEGFHMEQLLHQRLFEVATPEMAAHDLWLEFNRFMQAAGFENLDFKGNLGHSIATHLWERQYIEAGNGTPLKDFGLFTFEPHIRKSGGNWGFKHENIYCFSGGKVQVV